MGRKAIALSNDGYYVIYLMSEHEIGYKRTYIHQMYYISFSGILVISVIYAIFRNIYLLLLLVLPILSYLVVVVVSLNLYKPQIYEKIIQFEVKGNIIKIYTNKKTFIIRKRKIFNFIE